MAIFSSKKNTEATPTEAKPKVAKKEVAVATVVKETGPRDLAHIIRRPRITEKASMQAESNVYSFEVDVNANKRTIAAAVKEMFNVTPIKIAVMSIPKKEVFVRGRLGTKGGGKKAYVYLKKGETIEFV
jgi:large subunit ribosomal protein L23